MPEIAIGLTGETTQVVTTEKTAAYWGSGLVAAFATPALVALMENAAFNAVKPLLSETQTTVGAEVNIKHLAATPVGMTVRARAELSQMDGRKLVFKVEAWDDVEKIGEGTHTRFVVDLVRFNQRFEQKRAAKRTTDGKSG
ncbi:MAG: thioesterase family protein [Chloroflexi bacterium]|nr:thioesterase family protein [Chloroflexota bacterium]